MIWSLCAAAWAQQLELGVGRAAVLRPHVTPTSVAVSDPDVLEVLPVAPALVLFGKTSGRVALSIDHAGGTLEWEVIVRASGDPAGPLVDPPGEVLTLGAPGEGAWCKVPGTKATTMLDLGVGSAMPAGTDRTLVQAAGVGVADVVFETTKGPKVVTVVVGGGGPARLPAGCARPTEVVTLDPGQALEVAVGRKPAQIVVGRPDIVAAAASATPNSLTVTGLRAGWSTVLVRARDDEDPWAATVVVAPPR